MERESPLAVPFLEHVQAHVQPLQSLPEFDEIRAEARDARETLRLTIFQTCEAYDRSLAGQVYPALLRSLYSLCKASRIYIATTNYDRVLERLWQDPTLELHTGSPALELQDGFHQPEYGNRILDVDRGYPDPGETSDSVVHLIKLHGSIAWREYETGRVVDTGAIEYAGENAVLAYPVHADKSHERPFSDLFRAFDKALAASNFILLIGISLRDVGIVERLAEALRPGKKMAVIVDREPEPVRNQFPSEVRKYVVPMTREFGREDFAPQSADEWERFISEAREAWAQPGTVYHVLPDGNEWIVKREGAQRAGRRFSTNAAAAEFGVSIAKRNRPSQLIIHKQDGTFQDERTYNGYPFPPSG